MRPRTRAPFAALAWCWLALAPASAGAAELMLKGGLEDDADLALTAPTGIAVSRDGRSVYVAGFAEDAIDVFLRDAASGGLTHLGALRDGVNGVDGLAGAFTAIVSADGGNLYAASVDPDESVVIFHRDLATGWLGFLGRIQNGAGGVTGLEKPRSLAESGDGLFLYVTCEAAVVVFARDPSSGALGFVQSVPLPALSGAEGIAIAPDGLHVYVGGYAFAELRIYARDEATGMLALLDVVANGQDGVSGLAGVDTLVVTPDGGSVYANGTLDSSIVHFERDAATGLLQFVERHADGVAGVHGLHESAGLSLGGMLDSRVYAGGGDGSVAVFERDLTTGALRFATAIPLPGPSFTGSGQQILAFGEHLYVLNGLGDTLYLFSTAVLDYVETEQDGVAGANGLGGADAIALTPDGAQLYVAGETDDAVSVFQVDRRTGALAASSVVADGVGGVDGIATPRGVAVSPDARHVYVAGFNDASIAAFARSPSTGALSFIEFEKSGKNGVTEMLGPRTVVLSPDGRNLYTAAIVSDAVVWFTRDPATGGLGFGGFVKDGVGGADGLDSAYAVAISPDGRQVYAAGLLEDSLVVLARNAATGALTFASRVQDGVAGVDGLDSVRGIAVSPDGRNVYAAGYSDNAVAVFARDPATGALAFIERLRDNEIDVHRLNSPFSVVVSDDGHWVLAASSTENALDVFRRDRATGRLFLAQVEENGVDGIAGLVEPRAIAIARTGFASYVSNSTSGSVVAFAPEPAAGAIAAAVAASLAALARARARR